MASWKPVLDAVLDLYDDVSTLLRDLDYQMDRYGHGCLHPRHYGYEGTAALERPRTWLPTWLSRVYARHQEQAPRRLELLHLVAHDRGGPGLDRQVVGRADPRPVSRDAHRALRARIPVDEVGHVAHVSERRRRRERRGHRGDVASHEEPPFPSGQRGRAEKVARAGGARPRLVKMRHAPSVR